jgi:hypothetical protein
LPRWPRFDLGSGFAIETKEAKLPAVTSAKRIDARSFPHRIEMTFGPRSLDFVGLHSGMGKKTWTKAPATHS